jgi:ribosomal protein S18 acetylase RimI-like enzyme
MATTSFLPTPEWEHALSEIACPNHRLFVLKDGGQVVGWCRIFPRSCTSTVTTSELGIGLLPHYRHKGYGTMLMQEALDFAVQRGFKQVTLETHIENAPAHNLFQSFGFKPIERVNERVRMVRALNLPPVVTLSTRIDACVQNS